MGRGQGRRIGSALARRLGRREDLRTPILLYHRIGEPGLDPLQLGVTPARFDQHLDVLAAHADVVPLGEAARRRGTVALTFDDGFVDNVREAEPRLARRGFPAMLFVAPRYEPWWAALARLFLDRDTLPGELELVIGDQQLRRQVEPSAEAGRRLHEELFSLIAPLPEAEQRDAVDRLAAWAGADGPGETEPRILTRDEVASAAGRGVFAFGAHTLTHPSLAAVDAARQRDEIEGSKQWVEEATTRVAEDFAYPYGMHPPAAVRSVRRAGFRRAYVLEARSARPHDDPYRVPRFVVLDWDAETFERHLLAWLGSAR